MLPRRYIEEWKKFAPWPEDAQVEQDLVIEKAMLGTKLRALYQRKKGRDLFDLFHALTNLDLDTSALIKCYKEYMAYSVNRLPSRKQFLLNMEDKM